MEQKFNNILHINLLSHLIAKMIKFEKKSQIYLIGSKYPLKVKNVLDLMIKKKSKKPKIKIINSLRKNFLLSNKKL